MPITEQQLLQILPNCRPVVGIFVPALNRAMPRFKIDNRLRIAAFIAQVGHESGQLRRLIENLNYSAAGLVATWPTRFDKNTAAQYARQPERIAAVVYGSRMGNIQPGDGWRFRGRGLLQITGRSNYRTAGADLNLPLEQEPQLLEQPEQAALCSAWWWNQHGLNELADAGRFQDIGSLINTGKVGRVPHGTPARKALYDTALKVLN
ncbi:glycoside hydrolase family 19 [Pseudomonas sp. Leaf127]|uniref:glycoside hydrolase family 19 protein n=1 Tax=Pseudomonas sp. Leaf127 TaxID=1736267 RepID=UPI000702FCE1|nr:glycoside hydrolase family 19 protein [Pseudomonas sp. Leaf127]KQQ67850.1 glycoside hydrolase family 19 [Pseudomonas sp. Leaf127]